MNARFKRKTEFGIELAQFTAITGKSLKQVANEAGVKYSTLVECTTGRCAGHELIPTVREYMAAQVEEAANS